MIVDVLLNNGFSLLGEKVSYAEFFGQLCALAVVFLAKRRTLWAWPVKLGATVLLFAVDLRRTRRPGQSGRS